MTATYEMVELKDAGGNKLNGIMRCKGQLIPTFERPREIAEDMVDLVDMPIRDDDIMFCSAVKSGTHWILEIIHMLINGKAENVKHAEPVPMMEAIPRSRLDNLPSPRVLNSHLLFNMLPRQLKAPNDNYVFGPHRGSLPHLLAINQRLEKKTKIVLGIRNPKDVCVSFYHHHKGFKLFDYDGKFEDFVHMFLKGEVSYGDWFDYILKMEEEMTKGEYNIHLLYYEDMKESGCEEIKKLAKFLGISCNDELCEAINTKCHIKNMAAAKKVKPELHSQMAKSGFSLFRKGEIGDWKNHFTVAMNEAFDEFYNKRMKNCKLRFRFSPSGSN